MPKQMEVKLYLDDGWTISKIGETLKARTSIKEYAMILHDKDSDENGAHVKDHFHLYLHFGNTNWKYEDVAKWFGVKVNHVERVKSNKAFVLRYYTHEGQPEKHQYPVEAIVANFDVKAYLDKMAQKVNLDTLIAKCAAGEITRLNYTQYIDPIIYAKHRNLFDSAWKYSDAVLATKNDLSTQERPALWLHGDTSVGKSLLCKLLAGRQQLPIYFTSTGGDPFGEYHGEDIVVLDDLRPEKPFSFESLLKIIDPYNVCAVQSRYHNKYLTCKQIIVTSPMSPEQYAAQSYLQGENAAQLYRRLSEVWKVTQSDINISKYDLGLRSFVAIDTRPNPVPAYLATRAPSAPTFSGGDILTKLNAEYAPPTVPAAPAPSAGGSTPGGPTGTAADDEKEVLPF